MIFRISRVKIAGTFNSAPENRTDDIISYFGLLNFKLCCYVRFHTKIRQHPTPTKIVQLGSRAQGAQRRLRTFPSKLLLAALIQPSQ